MSNVQSGEQSSEEFVHKIAIKLSRALNLINPNDLLARRVVDIASRNNHDQFLKAAMTFGKFQESFLSELHADIHSYVLENSKNSKQPNAGVAVHELDVLAPEPVRMGGLVQNDSQRQHTFRKPAKPIEPPTPRDSLLGLDRLAMEKRAALQNQNGEGSRKKPRLDSDAPLFKVPSLPQSRTTVRQRGEETPSHPGGLSESARARLEEHRRTRDRQREGFTAQNESREVAPRGLGDFQRRSNRDRGWAAKGDRPQRIEAPTPRSVRGGRDDAPSVRVPNLAWDATPRSSRGDGDSGWGSARDRTWDATPRSRRGADDDSPGDDRVPLDAREWEEEQVRLDRDWYMTGEEGTVAGNEENNPLAMYDDLDRQREAEIATRQTKKISAKQAQYNADNDLWEANRMITSGVASRKALDLDFEDESESTVHVIVHDLKPPFLDGRTVYTKQLEPINPIRDPTSDMAVFSKKGSALVKEKREQAERAKAAAKMAALGGTSLGNIMGVKDEDAEGDENSKSSNGGDEGSNYKGDSKFASHLKAAPSTSSFSRSRTLKEQREYLPAFACRSDLMRVLRDNQVVVVVGETGSGKTTQLTQFLYEDGYCSYGIIGCTQPRRVAAMSVAKRVSEEMQCKLGSTVGYAIRFEDCTTPETKIKCPCVCNSRQTVSLTRQLQT
ncbi:hypothetical protein SISSUDRAFT_169695 [Sistotremastrum suecicum HHB10207 ss-3]|uniref:Helicase ATP-binding domain-containing protein n=1 Tax=Sistotremastrum suecicum HHB10207 ss-3 TaxID=1314776 RepID=A0A166ALQ5_9AGAM|nr:hypothetical protein SISSUDRAFT_169695 [Sistotremastrum suecicum HHB10207 ss-3]